MFARGHIARSKHYTTLVRASEAFIEHDIRPAAWCAFSCDVWLRYRKTHPPVSWVFGAKRIVERRGWFWRELQDYMGGRIVYTPAGRKLLRVNSRAQAHVFRTGSVEGMPVHELVTPGAYEALVRRARLQGEQMQRDLNSRVNNGEWIW